LIIPLDPKARDLFVCNSDISPISCFPLSFVESRFGLMTALIEPNSSKKVCQASL